MKRRNADEECIDAEVVQYKEDRKKKTGEEDEEVQEAIRRSRQKNPNGTNNNDDDGSNDSDSSQSSTSRGRGRGRGTRGARGSRAGAAETSTRGTHILNPSCLFVCNISLLYTCQCEADRVEGGLCLRVGSGKFFGKF